MTLKSITEQLATLRQHIDVLLPIEQADLRSYDGTIYSFSPGATTGSVVVGTAGATIGGGTMYYYNTGSPAFVKLTGTIGS
jgi:hypothetical protein